ncbi:MAG: hypothetical protein ABIQ73_25710 [Acidimicrobiales bacterium]
MAIDEPATGVEHRRVDSLLRDGDLKPRAVDHTITAVTTLSPDTDPLKSGTFGSHVVYADEPPSVGGSDAWPPPLGYAALAVGF